MSALSNSIKLEIKKVKNTPSLKLAIVSGLFIPLIYLIYYVTKYEMLIPEAGINPWNKYLGDQISNAAPFLIPILVILQSSLITQIEHKSNALKYIFVQPIPRWIAYMTKMAICIGLILVTYIVFIFSIIAFGYLIGDLREEIGLNLETLPLLKLINLCSIVFLANLGILGIQFWLSMRYRNFIVPIGIGMVLLITGLIIARAEEAIYFPYSFSLLSILSESSSEFTWLQPIGYSSILVLFLFTSFGILETTRKNIQ